MINVDLRIINYSTEIWIKGFLKKELKMKSLIDKYIKRIKIDYPEDDKLYIDLEAFANEINQQLHLHGDVWQSKQMPEFDVQEINNILKDCEENKDDLRTLITRIWNKGCITGVCFDSEND